MTDEDRKTWFARQQQLHAEVAQHLVAQLNSWGVEANFRYNGALSLLDTQDSEFLLGHLHTYTPEQSTFRVEKHEMSLCLSPLDNRENTTSCGALWTLEEGKRLTLDPKQLETDWAKGLAQAVMVRLLLTMLPNTQDLEQLEPQIQFGIYAGLKDGRNNLVYRHQTKNTDTLLLTLRSDPKENVGQISFTRFPNHATLSTALDTALLPLRSVRLQRESMLTRLGHSMQKAGHQISIDPKTESLRIMQGQEAVTSWCLSPKGQFPLEFTCLVHKPLSTTSMQELLHHVREVEKGQDKPATSLQPVIAQDMESSVELV